MRIIAGKLTGAPLRSAGSREAPKDSIGTIETSNRRVRSTTIRRKWYDQQIRPRNELHGTHCSKRPICPVAFQREPGPWCGERSL